METLDDMRSRFQNFILQISMITQGGDLNLAFALYDYLRRYPATVITMAEGIVASAGVIVFLAGEHRVIAPHSSVMIHLPENIFSERDSMTSRESELISGRIKCLETMFVSLIRKRTNLSLSAIRKFMNDGKFFYAKEAIKCGLAHDLLGSAG